MAHTKNTEQKESSMSSLVWIGVAFIVVCFVLFGVGPSIYEFIVNIF